MCVVYMCVCVCGGGSTRNTLVCASSEDSCESLRSLQSALFCADFYNNKFFIARLLGAYIQWPTNSKMNRFCCFLKHLDKIRHL